MSGRIYDKDLFQKIVNNYVEQRNKIDFQEEPTSGYRMRTIKNASADATFAFAIDFSTSGEKLTYQATVDQGKMYFPIPVSNLTQDKKDFIVSTAVTALNECGAKTLNIAGNGIATLAKSSIFIKDINNYIEALEKKEC